MGGIYCLPTTEDTPPTAAARDLQGPAGASLLLTQDGLGEEHRADAADDELTATALFCSPPVAQGSKRRSGNVTGHTAVDGARTGDIGTIGRALTGTAGGANGTRTGVVGDAGGALTDTAGGADNTQRAPTTTQMTPSRAPSTKPSSGHRRLAPPTTAPRMPHQV
jgi:hypothetical protein